MIDLELQGPSSKFWSRGQAVEHAPHFCVTWRNAVPHFSVSLYEIEDYPAITHIRTGYRVPMLISSLQAASIIAVVLEHLPIRWDGGVKEIMADYEALPEPIRQWLR